MESIIIKAGETLTKHRFVDNDSSALTLGRAFNNDVIINDPYIDEALLTITPALNETYNWHIQFKAHTNPVFLNNKSIETSEIDIRSGDTLTVGRSNIVFYAENHDVPATREFAYTNWLHNHTFKPYVALTMLSLSFVITLILSYQEIVTKINWSDLTTASFSAVFVVVLWAVGWALVSRLFKGNAYFSSHLFYTSLCFFLIMLTADLGGYVDYVFSSQIAGLVIDWLISFIIFGLLLGFHLALVSNSPKAARNGMLISACITASIAVLLYNNQPEYSNQPVHSVTVKPAIFPVSSPQSLDTYIADYDAMFDELDSTNKK